MNLRKHVFSAIVFSLLTFTSSTSAHSSDKVAASKETSFLSQDLIKKYYDSILSQNLPEFLGLLTLDVVHEINQGSTEIGKEKFKTFMTEQFSHGNIKIDDLIILTSADGKYATARFICSGNYSKPIEGFGPAKNQYWKIPVVSFFKINNGKISHVAVYYNKNDWMKQISL